MVSELCALDPVCFEVADLVIILDRSSRSWVFRFLYKSIRNPRVSWGCEESSLLWWFLHSVLVSKSLKI
ncbi:hypothetical protein HanRHA438_Chr08g0365221 [Helianthus annuus]|uniref:Uncharacterized protein n=1 Tax=Helianthus annuus TaxID=4232 RepID=A0A9K3NDV3_HELAN|nr:hypothetical protein HanXRQr2_Chr08g0353031 [Helianthus annuus]KAJ0548177.1 hypothetical protein HanIR_Chr08g0380671 [Helianthus annuus]KAJ0554590.1 hypothetical protein HanHA89_Chr08g0309701 [Helianthus annuus]KAJ0720153.1 hypothetical protein HanLR1_Chr08g0290031 [Helianthus annuus]KAJ0723383.1 hypothetical protein HanOQP8_Chr08g0297561 [Helianthus annuus]